MVVSHQTLLRAGEVFNESSFLPGRWEKSSRNLGLEGGFNKREGEKLAELGNSFLIGELPTPLALQF